MRVVFMGTPAYAIPVLEVLLAGDYQVVGAYTQLDKPRGRGRAEEPPPVKGFALEHGIEVFQSGSLRRPEVQRELACLSPDVIVVAAYGRILPPEVLSIPPFGCVNVHPSLLPRYRGPSPVATAILEGEAYTGTTIMFMDEGMDTGPTLTSKAVLIDVNATTESLTPRLFRLGAELLTEVLPLWLEGRVTPEPQDHSRATFTAKLKKNDGEARWEISAEDLERRLRAFTPWPGLFTFWNGKILKIVSAVPLSCPTHRSWSVAKGDIPSDASDVSGPEGEPGLVVPVKQPGIAVGVVTGRGTLGLKSLQMEGRRPVSSEEFLHGYRDFLGSRIPS